MIESNLHEQIILSLHWLYSVKNKVIPNRNSFIQNHGMNRIRGNKILFDHNYIVKVNHKVLQELDYDDDLAIYLYGKKDQLNKIAKKAYGKNKLYECKNVLN